MSALVPQLIQSPVDSSEGTDSDRTYSTASSPVMSARDDDTDASLTDYDGSDSDDDQEIDPLVMKFAPKVDRVVIREQIDPAKDWSVDYDFMKCFTGAGNLHWSMFVTRDEYECGEYLNLRVGCGNRSRQWSAATHVELSMTRGCCKTVIASFDHNFNWESDNDFVDKSLGDWCKISNPEMGYVGSNGEFNIEVKISFRTLTGVRLPAKHDFTSPSRLTDVILIVEERQVHANKAILAVASPVFKTLFFDESEDSEGIRIDNVIYKEFIRFLSHIYSPNNVITAGNVESLLALSHRFKTESLTESADAFLIYSEDFSIEQKLILGDKYNLLNLQNQCMDELDSTEKIKKIWRTKEYGMVADKIKVALLENVMLMK